MTLMKNRLENSAYYIADGNTGACADEHELLEQEIAAELSMRALEHQDSVDGVQRTHQYYTTQVSMEPDIERMFSESMARSEREERVNQQLLECGQSRSEYQETKQQLDKTQAERIDTGRFRGSYWEGAQSSGYAPQPKTSSRTHSRAASTGKFSTVESDGTATNTLVLDDTPGYANADSGGAKIASYVGSGLINESNPSAPPDSVNAQAEPEAEAPLTRSDLEGGLSMGALQENAIALEGASLQRHCEQISSYYNDANCIYCRLCRLYEPKELDYMVLQLSDAMYAKIGVFVRQNAIDGPEALQAAEAAFHAQFQNGLEYYKMVHYVHAHLALFAGPGRPQTAVDAACSETAARLAQLRAETRGARPRTNGCGDSAGRARLMRESFKAGCGAPAGGRAGPGADGQRRAVAALLRSRRK